MLVGIYSEPELLSSGLSPEFVIDCTNVDNFCKKRGPLYGTRTGNILEALARVGIKQVMAHVQIAFDQDGHYDEKLATESLKIEFTTIPQEIDESGIPILFRGKEKSFRNVTPWVDYGVVLPLETIFRDDFYHVDHQSLISCWQSYFEEYIKKFDDIYLTSEEWHAVRIISYLEDFYRYWGLESV